MTVAELSEALADYLAEGGSPGDTVRIAYQPSWPLVAEVATLHPGEGETGEPVAFIMAGADVGYYPGDRGDFSAY